MKSMAMTWANARGLRSGRTSRASLHASCLQIIFIIGLFIKVKVQCSKVKVKVPTCVRVTRQVSHIDNQRLIPYVPIIAILHDNLTHFTAQYGSFHLMKVHIKSEIWKNEAIKLSIKDLKGLLKAA